MPTFSRRPCSALAPWVQLLWATHVDAGERVVPYRERVLPTGAMHLVVRLSDTPLTLFEGATREASQTVGHSIVGGARSAYYVKLAGDAACSVGVQLQPGGALALLGAPASELAERHTQLDALWGTEARLLRERLHDTAQLPERLHDASEEILRARVDLMESVLLERLRTIDAQHREPGWLTHVMAGIDANVSLASIAEQCGVSHRTFITRFRNLVGLPPKVYARIRRFQRVVAASHAATGLRDGVPSSSGLRNGATFSLAQLAFDAGYADQAHLSREFLEFAGVSPSTYARFLPASANHVRIGP